MSQLSGLWIPVNYWIDEKRIWQGRRASRRIEANLTALRAILQAFNQYFLVPILCLKII